MSNSVCGGEKKYKKPHILTAEQRKPSLNNRSLCTKAACPTFGLFRRSILYKGKIGSNTWKEYQPGQIHRMLEHFNTKTQGPKEFTERQRFHSFYQPLRT